jgi:hypothetical protein
LYAGNTTAMRLPLIMQYFPRYFVGGLLES